MNDYLCDPNAIILVLGIWVLGSVSVSRMLENQEDLIIITHKIVNKNTPTFEIQERGNDEKVGNDDGDSHDGNDGSLREGLERDKGSVRDAHLQRAGRPSASAHHFSRHA